MQLDDRGVLIPCQACGRTNRLAYAALGRSARCSHCHAPLAGPNAPIEIPSTATFDAVIASSRLPVVVDFWAAWCAPCRMVAPELEQVARTAAGELLIVKVDTEALPDLSARYGVRSIPTMAVFRNGRELTRTAGARPAADILTFVRQATRTAA